MQKINFQDLPNTTTPINSNNLNQLQSNVENSINEFFNIKNFLGMLNYSQAFISRGFDIDENKYVFMKNHAIDSYNWAYENSNYFIYLEAGTYTFTAFFSILETSDSSGLQLRTSTGDILVNKSIKNQQKIVSTFTIAEGQSTGLFFKISNGKCKFQIEKGSVSHDYVEHINNTDLMYAEAKMYNNQKYTSTTSWEYIKVNLDRIVSSTPNLTIDSTNKEVVIGKNISKVIVSAKVTLTEAVTAPAILAKIYRNGTDITEETINETEGNTGNAFTTARVVNQMIRVTEGDTLSLIFATNTAQNEEKTIRSSYTYMRIQAFE